MCQHLQYSVEFYRYYWYHETVTKNPIKFIRLNTGEDIISEVVFVREEANFYLCINPMKIVYNVSGRPDSLVVAFSPWIFSSVCEKQQFPNFTGDVITIADPSGDIVDCYNEFVERMIDMKEENKLHRVESKKSRIEDDIGISQEEQEYLKAVIEELEKGSKRKLH